MKYLLLIAAFICFTNETIAQKPNEKLVAAVFKNWNQSTLASIEVQSKKAISPEWRLDFKQRVPVVTKILYSPTEFGKGEPDRIKFLKAIHIETLVLKHFFIIETSYSGEVAGARNYLIEDANDGSHIGVYVYYKNNWIWKFDTVISKVDLHSRIKNYQEYLNPDGYNSNDLTITEFNSLKIQSRYYVAVSIPENDGIL